jgi:hypothetical protein
MYLEKKQDYSVYHWMKSLFSDAPFVTVVDEFPSQLLTVPTVSIESRVLHLIRFELGDREGIKPRVFYINIFAQNKTQRDDFGYRIIHALEDGIPVYDYEEGFPENGATPAVIGLMSAEDIKLEWVRVVPEFTEKMYWRAIVSFLAEYNKK